MKWNLHLSVLGEQWIWTLNLNTTTLTKHNTKIIDLGSLKLNIKWEKTINQGMLNGDYTMYVY
jgi:hypothetical protein